MWLFMFKIRSFEKKTYVLTYTYKFVTKNITIAFVTRKEKQTFNQTPSAAVYFNSGSIR